MFVSDHLLVTATETFLDSSVEDAEVVPDGWTLLRRDRASPGGGVLLAARPGVTVRRRRELESELGEDLWASVTYRGFSFNVCIVYIKPKATDAVYMNVFCKIESFLANSNMKFYIFGDLNMNSSTYNIKNYYCYFLTYCNLVDHNEIVNSHGGILDVVLAQECTESGSRHVWVSEAAAGFVPLDELYHPALEITVTLRLHNNNCARLHPTNIDTSRDWNFKKMDVSLFISLLADISWAPVLECNNVTVATDTFYNIMYSLFDLSVPKKKRQTVKSNRYPVWFDASIIKDIRRKTKLHKYWLTSKCTDTYRLFSDLRADLKMRISLAYKTHMTIIEDNLVLHPQQFWNHVHSLRSKGGFEPCVSYKGNSFSGVEAAEAFADYFSSVFLNELPELNASACREQDGYGAYVSIPSVLPEDIERGLNKLKLGSSPGPDNLPSFVLKTGKKHLILPLYHILNLSLKNGQYPDQWKLSRVTPIPKSSNRTLVEEYRPIAILCAPAKVFEYILHNEIYTQVRHQIGEEQHGFRPGRSVNTNLLGLVDFISSALDRGSQVDVIYFDFQKAFDKVCNDILLGKLDTIGFSPSLLNFFSDFMKDRRQFVKYGIHLSQPYHTRSGISQGSITGPLLFQIMTHDLPKVLDTAKCLLYADDLKLFIEIKSTDDCESLQNDINQIYEWSVRNKMTFNTNKCNVMTFDRKKNPIIFNYNLNSFPVNRVGRIKDLGVTFDRGLTFHDHISELAKEAYRRLGFVLRNARDFENPQVVRTLYNSLVRSKLEASACVWNPYHVTYTRMLEKVQKAFLRMLYKKLYGYYPFLYPTKFLLGQLGYNSLEVRRMTDQLTICCKVVRGAVDSVSLHDLVGRLFVPDEPGVPASRRGRRNNLFYIDDNRTVARSMSPLIRARRHFNALLAANSDFDIFCDNWKTVMTTFLTYSENQIDQWDRGKKPDRDLDFMT